MTADTFRELYDRQVDTEGFVICRFCGLLDRRGCPHTVDDFQTTPMEVSIRSLGGAPSWRLGPEPEAPVLQIRVNAAGIPLRNVYP